MNTEKLNAIRVELIEWKTPDHSTLELLFKKVPTYTYKTDHTQAKESSVIFFTDFGYLKLRLNGEGIGIREKDNWLNEYINDDQVFIEEEVENEITFWEGEEENGYDWSNSYSISFESKQVTYSHLSNEEWNQKYLDLALSWKDEADFNQQKHQEWYALI